MEPELADLIRAHRLRHGISVQEMADALDVGHQTVHGWQLGNHPTYATLMRIAKLFGLTMIELHTMPRGAAKCARRRA